jgi:hypothetical protein
VARSVRQLSDSLFSSLKHALLLSFTHWACLGGEPEGHDCHRPVFATKLSAGREALSQPTWVSDRVIDNCRGRPATTSPATSWRVRLDILAVIAPELCVLCSWRARH